MAANDIEILIRARDEASRDLAQLDARVREVTASMGTSTRAAAVLIEQSSSRITGAYRQTAEAARLVAGSTDVLMGGFTRPLPAVQAFEQSVVRVDQSLRVAGAGVRAFALPLASELAPALGTAAGRMASVLAAAASMPSAMLAIGTAAGGLAAILAGSLVASWQKSQEAAAGFQRAMAGLDLARVSAEISRVRGELEKLNAEIDDLTPLLGSGDPRTRSRAQQALRQPEAERRTRSRELLDLETRAKEIRDLADLDRLEQLGLESSAALLRRFAVEQAEERRRANELRSRRQVFLPEGSEERFAFGLSLADRELLEQQEEGLRGLRMARLPAVPPGMGAEERFSFELTPDDQELLRRGEEGLLRRQALTREQITLDLERLTLLERAPGLTVAEREALASRVSLERESLGLAQLELETRRELAALEPRRRQGENVDAEAAEIRRVAELRRQNIRLSEGLVQSGAERARLERTDPMAGLAAGLRDLGEDFESTGAAMRRIAVATAHDINRAFVETWFQPFEKQLRAMPPLLQAVFRSFSGIAEEFVRQAITRPLVGQLQGFLGGAPGPFVGSAAGPVNVTGAPGEVLAALQAQGVPLVQGPGGQTYAMPGAGGLPVLSPAGGSAAVLEATGRGGLYDRTTGPGVGTYAASGVVAALAAYGIYTSGVAMASPELSGLTGAATGALTGASIGALYGSAGGPIGAGIGAVVGLALGVAGGLAGEARARRAQRERRDQEDTQHLVQEIQRLLESPRPLGDLLAERLLYRVPRLDLGEGGQPGQALPFSLGGVLLGLAQAAGHQDLAAFLASRGVQAEVYSYRTLRGYAEIVARLGGPDQARRFLDGVLRALEGRQALEERVLFGFHEHTPGGEVTRTTYLPFSGLELVSPGSQLLFWSGELAREAGLTEDQVAVFADRLRRVSIRRDIPLDDLSGPAFLQG